MPAAGGGSGGGGSAGDVRAGGAYYEVVGRDGVSKVLDRIGDKIKTFSGTMSKVHASAFTGGLLGGFLGTTFGESIQEITQKAGEGFRRLFEDVRKVKTEIEMVTFRAKEMEDWLSRKEKKDVEKRADIEDLPARLAAITEARKRAMDAGVAAESKREPAESKLADVEDFDITHVPGWLMGKHASKVAKAAAAVDAVDAEVAGAVGRIRSRDDEFDVVLKLVRERTAALAVTGVEGGAAALARFEPVPELPPWFKNIVDTAGTIGGRILPQDIPMFNMPFAAIQQLAAAQPPAWQLADSLRSIPTEVRSGFATGMSRQQFGYGSSAQLDVAKDTLEEIKQRLPENIGNAVALAMTFK